MEENKEASSRKEVLRGVAETLRNFDFKNFDPRTDKAILMDELKIINGKLGALLKGYK